MKHLLTRDLDGESLTYSLDLYYHRTPYYEAVPRGWDEPGEAAWGGEVVLDAAYFDGVVFLLSEAETDEIEEMINAKEPM